MKILLFSDASGLSPCGSDCFTYADGRLNLQGLKNAASEHRESYRTHFPHKYAQMSHFRIVPNLRVSPTTFHLFKI